MSFRVLDVGNCDPDFSSISALLAQHFQAEVQRAHGMDDALNLLQSGQYDLVTINRLMDRDGAAGIDIIKAIKADPALQATTVMMITNFPEHHELAQQAGAVMGFGKASLYDAATIELLAQYLA